MNPADCRILVVDDHALQRLLLVRMLGALPVAEVAEAGNGDDALAQISDAAAPFDLVITDLDMPGMDGMELARRIAALTLPPPVALVSALDSRILASVGNLSRAAGGALQSILPKPVSVDALREAISRIGQPRPASVALPGFSDAELAEGLAAGEFQPWFEPQIELGSGEIVGFEALVRWHHPTLGVLAPFRFIEQIERNPGLIATLTDSVLRQSLAALTHWQAAGYCGSLSVNLSPLVLAEIDFANRLCAIVAEYGIAAETLILELTESAAANGSAAIENITRLRMRGFRLSIDDFGTGYSSLQQLSRLPLTELKIDRSFTSRMREDPVSRAAIESSLHLAQRLSLRSCGEGIETAEQVRELRWMGCLVGQGYLFTRPIPGEQLLDWLAHWPARRGALIEEWRAD
jgi:EAL domain-containing protein (putative c-di-GMP-specific phosphodiesterase class I)